MLNIAIVCCLNQYCDFENHNWFINIVDNFSEIKSIYYKLLNELSV